MLKHLSTTLCNNALVDSETSLYSFINIINGFNLAGPEPNIPENKDRVYLPLQFKIGTFWEWGDCNIEDRKVDNISRMVRFYSPAGDLLVQETPGSRDTSVSKSRASAIISVVQFPFVGFGVYRVGAKLCLGEPSHDDQTEFVTIPFEINDHTTKINTLSGVQLPSVEK